MYAIIHYSPPKGGAFAPPLPHLNPPLYSVCMCVQVCLIIHKVATGACDGMPDNADRLSAWLIVAECINARL